MRQRDGSLLCRLPAPDGEGEVTGALSHWVSGIGGNLLPGRTLAHIGRIGEVMALLHRHSASWERPSEFVRPQWDPEQLEPSIEELEKAAHAGKMEPQIFFALKQTAAHALEHMRAIERTPETWGLIHGDLGHLGNCVYDRNEVSPIDFNDCAFGFYLYDIAHAFLYTHSRERRAFLNGYQTHRPLPADFQPQIEGFMVAAQINLLARFAPHPHKRLDYASRFVARECTAFIHGRPFLFERSWWE